jgi:hypothetical protein
VNGRFVTDSRRPNVLASLRAIDSYWPACACWGSALLGSAPRPARGVYKFPLWVDKLIMLFLTFVVIHASYDDARKNRRIQGLELKKKNGRG